MSNHSLLASWRQSLSLLRWSNLKLFLLVSFKAIKDQWKLFLVGAAIYSVILGYFLEGQYFVENMFKISHPEEIVLTFLIVVAPYFNIKSSLIITMLLTEFMVLLTCFALFYFTENKVKLVNFKRLIGIISLIVANFVLGIGVVFLGIMVSGFLGYVLKDIPISLFVFIILLARVFYFVGLRCIYFSFFDLLKIPDLNSTSIINCFFKFFYMFCHGIIFVWYNLPILSIGYGLYWAMHIATIVLVGWGQVHYQELFLDYQQPLLLIRLFFVAVNAIIFLAFLSTLYTKKVHDQREL